MAERAKVRWSQLKVGVLALTAFVIVFVLVFLLTSSKGIFQQNAVLYTYMEDASGMANGTPVRLNGILVGYLDQLRLTNSRDPKRAVQFVLMVKGKFLADIPIDSVATIAAANLLGDKFINITKGQDTRTVMSQSANVLQSFQTIVKRVDSLLAGVEAAKGNIGLLLKDDELYRRLNGIASEGQKLLSDVRTGNGSLSKLIFSDEFYQELRSPLHRIDKMLADLDAGQGSAGKLLHDPALYDEMQKSVGEIHT